MTTTPVEQHQAGTVRVTYSAGAVPSRGLLRGVLRSLRPRQWTRNGLVFIAVVFSGNLSNPHLVLTALAACAVFCALSSAGYLLNDVADADIDRLHPTKRFRPIATGVVPVPLALALAAVLGAAGVLGSLMLGPSFSLLALAYLVLTSAYSRWLKHLVFIDIFGIAAGFVLRAAAGAAAIAVPVSPWLYAATLLGALLIALGKWRAELHVLGDAAAEHRASLASYSVELLDQLTVIVSSVALMTYGLYTFSAENLPPDHRMMLTIPVVLYGMSRFLYLVRTTNVGGAPEELLLQDRPLAAAVVLWGVLALAVLYLGPVLGL